MAGCESESNVRDHGDQELSAAGWQDGQQLREIDKKLAQLKKSSPQQVRLCCISRENNSYNTFANCYPAQYFMHNTGCIFLVYCDAVCPI